MFSRQEAALAYALAAERLIGGEEAFLQGNRAVVPIFVTQLFQSLEVSIKCVGIDSGLINESDARSKQTRSGHGIEELASLVNERLLADSSDPLVQALTFRREDPTHAEIIRKMIRGSEFMRTRESYATRRLGYGEVSEGDFAVVEGLNPWVAAIKQTAQDLPRSVAIVSQWASQPRRPGPFAIWLAA